MALAHFVIPGPDIISKGNLKEQIRMMQLRVDPGEVSRSISEWVKDPGMDFGW